jgi:hypothetical protein
VGKLARFPSTPSNPTILLHQLLEIVDDIESLTVVVRWKADQSVDTHWSQQKISELMLAARTLQLESDDLIRASREEE